MMRALGEPPSRPLRRNGRRVREAVPLVLALLAVFMGLAGALP